MKNKLIIALAVLALVFGMILTACDDGALLQIEDKTQNGTGHNTILDKSKLGTFTDHDATDKPKDTLITPGSTTSATDSGVKAGLNVN